MNIIAAFGKSGVNIFLVISSYYLIDLSLKSKPKISKILILIGEVIFYSILMYFISVLYYNSFSLIDLIKSLMPFLFDFYWFVITYLVLYILHSYLNVFIVTLDRNNYKRLLYITTGLFVIIPTFFYKSPEFSNLVWFIYVYVLIGYLKKYKDSFFNKILEKYSVKICFISCAFLIITILLFNILGKNITIFFKHSAYFSSINKIPSILISISSFYMCISLKAKYNKLINSISSSVLAVYLIHDNPYFSKILWEKIVNVKEYVLSNYLIINFFISCSAIFVLSIFIDKIRVVIIETPVKIILKKVGIKDFLERKLKIYEQF